MTNNHARISRRQFLKGTSSVGLGLVIGVSLVDSRPSFAAIASKPIEPNAFVRVAPDNTVTIIIKHHEMGQGVTTGLATLVADELDADWGQVRTEYAPVNQALYKNLTLGFQVTGGSTSIANSYEQMRKAGAMARAMLVSAAAKNWGVDEDSVTVERGILRSAGREATFGDMAVAAATLVPPVEVRLKSPGDFVFIGRKVPRLDSVAKTHGTACYTIDVKLPGLLTAVVAHPPKFGAKLKSFDASKAMAVKGVRKVVAIPERVAVVATGMWPAIKGRKALNAVWDESDTETRSSSDIASENKSHLDKSGAIAYNVGDAQAGFAKSSTLIDATYEFPYLAHATMEPMNCVVWLRDGKLETWSGHQAPAWDQMNAAKAAGLDPSQVIVNTLISGGSFGRRGLPSSDFTVEAVHVAKAVGGAAPIRLQRTREDDMRAGYYRPTYAHRVRAALDEHGNIVAWSHRIAGQSVMSGTFLATHIKDGVDRTSVEGAVNIPYAIPNATVDLYTTSAGVPVHFWRSVGNTHTAYAVETMIDELATAAKSDPVDFRLAFLKDKHRHATVLKLAAEKAQWGNPLPAGRARGVALHSSFNSVVAQVVELRLGDEGAVKVDRVVVALDCGQVVNPDIVRSQMEGSVGFALSAALYSEVTLDQGRIIQSNFDNYPVIRIDAMPKVEVYLVDSHEKPSGVGEPGVPPLAPAVANAVAALTGKRTRVLPFSRTKLTTA